MITVKFFSEIILQCEFLIKKEQTNALQDVLASNNRNDILNKRRVRTFL